MRRHKSLKAYRCVYCGARADTIDHVPPKGGLTPPEILVRACAHCNSILSSHDYLETIERRAKYLYDWWSCANRGSIDPLRMLNFLAVASGRDARDIPDDLEAGIRPRADAA